MPIVEPAFGNIPIELVRPSATNPRKRFSEASLDELAKSIRQSGIGQPILVRPLANIESDVPDRVEIVAGERRYRASKLAGLTTIPAIVRDMSDAEVLEFQLVENLQREDVHPIEEAEGYERLMKEHKFTADECAEKVGKSRSYIYGRLKFCALTPEARTAFYDGALNASTALLIARIPIPSLQKQAAEEITTWQGGLSYRAAVTHIHRRYMLELADAPFSIIDIKLVPSAGSCAECPKRTGNQPEIFADVESADVCTDPDCFESKKKAHHESIFQAAQANGMLVIDSSVTDAPGGHQDPEFIRGTSGLWRMDRVTPEARNKYLNNALEPNQMPQPASYIKNDDGEMIPVFSKTAVQEALEKAGLCLTLEQHNAATQEKLSGVGRPENDDAGPSEREKERQALLQENQRRVDFEQMVRSIVYGKIRTAAKEPGSTLSVLQVIARLMLSEWSLPDDVMEYDFDATSDDQVSEHIQQCTLGDLVALMLDISVGTALTTTAWALDRNEMDEDPCYCAIRELAKAVDIDIDQLREDMSKPAAPETEVKAEKPTGKKKTAKSKAKDTSSTVSDPAAAWPFPTGTRP